MLNFSNLFQIYAFPFLWGVILEISRWLTELRTGCRKMTAWLQHSLQFLIDLQNVVSSEFTEDIWFLSNCKQISEFKQSKPLLQWGKKMNLSIRNARKKRGLITFLFVIASLFKMPDKYVKGPHLKFDRIYGLQTEDILETEFPASLW